MPGVNAPNAAGAPIVSDRGAGTMPPAQPWVQRSMFATSPLSRITCEVESSVPSAAVHVIVQFSRRKPFGPMTRPSARYGGFGRTDGLTSHVNWPPAGTFRLDSRWVGIASGGVV